MRPCFTTGLPLSLQSKLKEQATNGDIEAAQPCLSSFNSSIMNGVCGQIESGRKRRKKHIHVEKSLGLLCFMWLLPTMDQAIDDGQVVAHIQRVSAAQVFPP